MPARGPKPWGASRAFAVLAGALAFAAVLNAGEMERRAEQRPFGRERDLWLAIWGPLADASHATGFDRPRAWLTDLGDAGRPDAPALAFPAPPAERGPTPFAVVPAPTGDAQPPLPPAPGGEWSEPGLELTFPLPAAPAHLLRTPSAEQPLALWAGGDSMARILGESVVRIANASGLYQAVLDARISSGLTRPDYFDWPAQLASVAASNAPEVFVVVFGANDSQGIRTPEGRVYQPGDDGWAAEYRRRVAGTMDLLRAEHRLVAWVGQPPMRAEGFSARMAAINAIFREEAALRPWVRYVDLWPLFAGESGHYEAYLPDDGGNLQLMRNADGIHFSREGGDRAARAILAIVGAAAGLE